MNRFDFNPTISTWFITPFVKKNLKTYGMPLPYLYLACDNVVIELNKPWIIYLISILSDNVKRKLNRF